MRKIVQYDAIQRLGLNDLVDIVNERIKEWWEPFGGISYATSGWFSQAVVVYEEIQ